LAAHVALVRLYPLVLSVHVALHGPGFGRREVALDALSDSVDYLDVFRRERSVADGEGSGQPCSRVFCRRTARESRSIGRMIDLMTMSSVNY
jgi:hypothetical protein